MALSDQQREIMALCLRADPPDAAFAALGDPRAWRAYREMVRDRLWKQIRSALPRSCALVPDALFARTFAWHLEHEPPRSRYFRDVVGAFVASALPLWAADPELPATCLDMTRYELALWEVSDLEAAPETTVRDFDFDRVPVLSHALRCIEVQHAVHTGADPAPGKYYLCVHRATDSDRTRTWSLTRVTYELLQQLAQGNATVSDIVRRMAADARVPLNAAYVDAVCTTLAQFLELGILLGST